MHSVYLDGVAASDLASQEEEDGQDRRFLEDLDDQPNELPLSHDCQAARVWNLVTDELDAIQLVDARETEEHQDEEEQPPVPSSDVEPGVIQHHPCPCCRFRWDPNLYQGSPPGWPRLA